MIEYRMSVQRISGCGAVGSALPWGGRGRKFKSCHSDHIAVSLYAYGDIFFILGSASLFRYPFSKKKGEFKFIFQKWQNSLFATLSTTKKAVLHRTAFLVRCIELKITDYSMVISGLLAVSGIFLSIKQIGHIFQTDAQGGNIVQQSR